MRLALCTVVALVGAVSSSGSARAQTAAPPPPAPVRLPPILLSALSAAGLSAYPGGSSRRPGYPGAYLPGAYPPVTASKTVRRRRRRPPVAEKKLGVGYKIGNGLGFVGADVIIAPVEHFALDLQANYFSASEPTGTAMGLGYVRRRAGAAWRTGASCSTPYAGARLSCTTSLWAPRRSDSGLGFRVRLRTSATSGAGTRASASSWAADSLTSGRSRSSAQAPASRRRVAGSRTSRRACATCSSEASTGGRWLAPSTPKR